MAFKSGIVVMAPDGDPNRHRAWIKTTKLDLTIVVVKLMDFDQAVEVCQDLVENQGVQSLILCPGFSHEAVAKIAQAVGDKIAISVARGDVPSMRITGEIMEKEGWFPKGH